MIYQDNKLFKMFILMIGSWIVQEKHN